MMLLLLRKPHDHEWIVLSGCARFTGLGFAFADTPP
jgi:hypothetical protein